MKKVTLFLYAIILVMTCFISNIYGSVIPHIIFVHLGNTIPDYGYIALEQARLFNEDAHLCLIANKKALENAAYDFAQQSIITVACEDLPCSATHQIFNRYTTLDRQRRDGFWHKATERFFYIHEYAALHNLTSIVHLETDTMLYANIADMRDALSQYKGIGAVFDCDTRCIPCFMYIANADAIGHLVDFIAHHAAHGYNDMEIIAQYRAAFSQQYIDSLPLVIPEYCAHHKLVNAQNQMAANPSDYFNNIEFFNSIFDGAAIGQFLGGIDPRNGKSEPGFINETSLFNPSLVSIEWHRDERNRNVPYAVSNGKLYRINNLHIHSKMLEKFRS